MAKDERDPVEETPSVDSTADAVDSAANAGRDDSPESAEFVDDAPADPELDNEPGDEGLGDDELEIDDPAALERATERVSESEPGDDDELVDEPTDAELAALTEGSDATAKAAREGDGDDVADAGDDRELVGVGAPTRGSAARAKGAKPKTEKKGRATAKQDSHAPVHKRTGPVTFVKESAGELRKVVYPTGPQLLNYFVVVLIFVLFIIAFVSVLDLAFGWAILKVFS